MWSERHSSNQSQSRNPSKLDAACQIIADISLRLFLGMYLRLTLLKRPSNIKAVRHQSEYWSLPGGKFPCCIIKSVFFFPYLSSPVQPPLLPHPSIFDSAAPHYSFVSQLRESDPSRLSPLCVILPPPWHLCFRMSIIVLICHLLAPHMKEKTSWFAILRDRFSSETWKL